MTDTGITVSMPQAGQQIRVDVKPGESVSLSDIDLSAVKIDIVGPDVVMSDPATGAQIFFPGLALIMFSESDAPQFIHNETPVSAQDILSKIGTIENITQNDLFSFTSLETEDQDSLEEKEADTAAPEDHSEQMQKAADDFFDIASYLEAFKQSAESNNSSQLRVDAQEQQNTPSNDVMQSVKSSRAEFMKDADGALKAKPVPPPASRGTPEEYNDQHKEDFTAPKNDGEPIEGPTGRFSFKVDFLQVGGTNELGGDVIRGGGGSLLSTVLPDPAHQFSSETINTSTINMAHTIYADNPLLFSNTMAARVLSLVPDLLPGYDVTQVVISGIPADFELGYYDQTANTFTSIARTGANYVLDNPALTETDKIELVVRYPIPNAASGFNLNIQMRSEYDPLSGETEPAENQKVQVYDIPEQSVAIKTVNSPSDAAGNKHVLSNVANGNIITTSDADVTVYGGQGKDTITTGAGNDVIYGSLGNDTIQAGAGIDTLNFSLMTSPLDVNLVTKSASINNAQYVQSIKGFENLVGGSGSDILTGNELDNNIKGGAGNDTISGYLGNNALDGGEGVDTVRFDFTNTTVNANLTTGTANIGGAISTLANFERMVGGKGNDYLYGDAASNIIWGDAGDDTLIGAGGNDRLVGGAGSDLFIAELNDGDDTIDGDDGIAGVTGVVNSVDYSQFASPAGLNVNFNTTDAEQYTSVYINGETDRIRNITKLIGTTADDVMVNNGTGRFLIGGAGNDIITGGTGNDFIAGGTGNNTLNGGGGLDTISFHDLATSVQVDVKESTARHGANTTLFAGFSRYDLTNHNDTFISSSHENDYARGLAGDDYFYGSDGNDTFFGDEGIDTIDYSAAAGGISVDIGGETGTATGSMGSDALYGFENIRTGAGNDSIHGSSANNIIVSGAGNDTILSSLGADTIDGGDGEDILDYHNNGERIYVTMNTIDSNGYNEVGKDINGTIDKIKSIEKIYGSNFDDYFVGDSRNNNFNGGAGADNFSGSLGNDIYDGGDAIFVDTITYLYQKNIVVDMEITNADGYSEVTITADGKTDLIKNIENIYGSNYALAGDIIKGNDLNNYFRGNAGDDILYGRGGNDNLVGDTGNDTIYGGTGNDTIAGGAGNDTLFGDEGHDNFIMYHTGADVIDGGTGIDTIGYNTLNSNLNFNINLSTNMDNLGNSFSNIENVLGSRFDDVITGSSGNNLLEGFMGNDVISGMDGEDQLNGGEGNDTLIGGKGYDILDGGNGNDTADYSLAADYVEVDLNDNMAWRDGDGLFDELYDIENVTGSDYNDHLMGNSYDNILAGGAGDDVLEGRGGSNTLNGGDGADTAVYTAHNGSIRYESGAVIKTSAAGGTVLGTDALIDIEKIIGGSHNDTFNLDTSELADFSLINGGTGYDRIALSGGLSDDGLTLNSIFNDIEEIDFTGSTLFGGDQFDLSMNDIIGITDANNKLRLAVGSDFDLNIIPTGYSLTNSDSLDNVNTYVFTSDSDPTETVTLEIETVATS